MRASTAPGMHDGRWRGGLTVIGSVYRIKLIEFCVPTCGSRVPEYEIKSTNIVAIAASVKAVP
jgi:hypothetical protein